VNSPGAANRHPFDCKASSSLDTMKEDAWQYSSTLSSPVYEAGALNIAASPSSSVFSPSWKEQNLSV